MNAKSTAATYLSEANQLLEEGNLEEAIAAYRNAIELDPKSYLSQHKLGEALVQQGKLDAAAAGYRKAIELNPDFCWSYHYLGEVLTKQGKLEEAIISYRRATELNPEFSWSYHHLGDVLVRQQQWSEAAAVFGKAIELDPQHFGSYCGLGQSLIELGQLDEAIAAYRQACGLNPDVDWIHHSLGNALRLRTKFDLRDAIASYRRSIDLNPDDVQAYRKLLKLQPDNFQVYLDLGNALAKQGEFDGAIATYQKAIKLNSQEALVHEYLGEVLEQVGNLEAAVVSYRKAIELYPSFMSDEQLGKALAKLSYLEQFPPDDAAFLQKSCHLSDADFVQELFDNYLKRSLNDEGIAAFLDVMRSSGRTREQTISEIIRPSLEFQNQYKYFFSASFEEVHGRLGTFFAQQGKWDEALASFHRLFLLKADIALAYSRWEENLALEKKYDEQVAWRSTFFTALLNQSYSADFYACFGKILALRGRFNEAIQAYQKSLLIQPYSTEAGEIYLNLGQLQLQHNQWEEALIYYNEASKITSNRWEIYINLGHISSHYNQPQAAIIHYKKAIEVSPEKSEFYINLGHILVRTNQIDEAIKFYKKALSKTDIHYHAYHALANCLEQQQRFDEAVSCLEELINQEIPATYPETLRLLGNIKLKQGKVEEANACFQKAQPVVYPQGFYATSREWVVQSNWELSNYIDIHPSHQIQIPLPKTLDKDVHPWLKDMSNFESPATFAAIVPQGRYCQLDGRQTAYITPDNQVLLDVSSFLNPGNLSELSLPSIHEVNGTVAVLSGNTSAIYYHWIIDALPKLGLIELSGIELDSIDKFVVRSYESDFHRETLDIMGIPADKIIDGNKYPHVKADRLVISSYPGIICCPTKWATDFLRSKFLPAAAKFKSKHPERIYITRRTAGNRRIINEDEVLEVLNLLGFVTVTAESMSIVEKISLLSGAKVVVGLSGGGMTNLLFCSPGTKVIEIFPPHLVGAYYYLLSAHLGLDYYYLMGEGIECSYIRQLIYNIDGFEDTFVNINSLKAVLNMAGII